ncbi:hypothetical protein VLK31_07155 [Variovorax sp. H27-G14]|uniref:hypothetical protein n=1 Tax=Variovorax sp. H27-G14 TaxID=3111914 RepID=UPI0038FCE55D
MKLSTGLRNYLLSTGSLKAALAGGEIRIYSGTVPATADDAIGSAVLLVTIKNAGAGINFDTAAAAGVLPKAPGETWTGVNVATNSSSFFRHVLAADTGASSTTAARIQGTCAVAGADLNLTSTSLTSGATQTIDSYTVAQPAG